MPFLFAPVALNVASAQPVEPKTPYTLRVGYAYLSDKDARDATNDSGYSVGLSYALGKLVKNANGSVSVDLDFTRHAGNGNKIETWSLLGVYRAPLSPQFYYGVGAGLANTLASQGAIGAAPAISERQTVLAGVILVGAPVGENGSLELSYRLQGKVSGVTANTFALTYGYRF